MGTVVVITGASTGIGRALAHEYAGVGCQIVLAARSRERLEQVAQEVRALGGRPLVVPTDVSDPAQGEALVEETVAETGRLDILINNAGYGLRALMEEVSDAEMQRQFEVNVFAPVRLARAAIPAMRAQGQGQIINVGSVLGRRALPSLGPYCMSKFAVAAFSEALRAEVARHGIHVLEVEPGQTRTEFLENQEVAGDHPPYGHLGSAMSAEACARRIVRAARRRRDRLVLGAPGRFMILANALAPGLLNRLLARYVDRGYSSGSSGPSR